MSASAPRRVFGTTCCSSLAGAGAVAAVASGDLPRVACMMEMVMSGYVASKATMPPATGCKQVEHHGRML